MEVSTFDFGDLLHGTAEADELMLDDSFRLLEVSYAPGVTPFKRSFASISGEGVQYSPTSNVYESKHDARDTEAASESDGVVVDNKRKF